MVSPGSSALQAVICYRMAGFKVSRSPSSCLFLSLVPKTSNKIVPVNQVLSFAVHRRTSTAQNVPKPILEQETMLSLRLTAPSPLRELEALAHLFQQCQHKKEKNILIDYEKIDQP